MIQRKIAEVEAEKVDQTQQQAQYSNMGKMQEELAQIEKNNNMLLLIERQYVKEIERRKKIEERKETGEECIDSPLRRAREYAMSIGYSPSPLRKKKNNLDSYGFQISPEKTTNELRMAKKDKN